MQTLRKHTLTNFKIATCIRNLTTTEISTALRPFYFAVHPDFFGQHPTEQAINENSLKQLSSVLETLQLRKSFRPISLPFYLKQNQHDSNFKYVKIYLKTSDIRENIISILKSCDLSTEFVEKIPKPKIVPPKPEAIKIKVEDIDFTKFSENDPIFGQYVMNERIKAERDTYLLKNWLGKNHNKAKDLAELNRPLTEDVKKLEESIKCKLGLLDLRWNCGWNEMHYRGCLLSFQSLLEQYWNIMHILKGRILIFAPFTGVSLDGHIMLNSGEVRHNWLELIHNVQNYDINLSRIPNFEKAVSQVLRNIKVGRRKFMFKILARDYEKNLLQITTNLSDYLSYRKFPKQWPASLNDFEIVVENEAGPLMVSPTGQFIVPCSLPGQLLVNFITSNLEEAKIKTNNYKQDKYTEKFLQQKCKDEFGLVALHKDDNVTPELMIKCCESLLANKYEIETYLKNVKLNICTYYSVLSDGVICIPWNFKL